MRTNFTLALIALTASVNAQCPHDPVITPGEVIMCPNEEVELSTQQADSYQWLKDGMPIPNATQQTLLVNYTDDGGSLFSVIATVDGCSEASPALLVDGWAFLLPYVIHEGDEPVLITGKGESYYCPGAFIQLTLGSVTVNLQWYKDGSPIPGANGQSLIVTEDGYYTASGAPGVCPDFIMNLGVEIPIFFLEESAPVIVPINEQLCFYPTTSVFQWYLNGAPIAEAECFTPTISGEYTVAATYECGPILSEPFDIVLGINDQNRAVAAVQPNPAIDAITVRSETPLSGAWRLIDASGRPVLAGRFSGCIACGIDVSRISSGEYALVPVGEASFLPARIVVLRQ